MNFLKISLQIKNKFSEIYQFLGAVGGGNFVHSKNSPKI